MLRQELQGRRDLVGSRGARVIPRAPTIGGVALALDARDVVEPWSCDPAHRAFLDRDASLRLPLSLHFGRLPKLGWSDLRYGDRLWAIRERSGHFLLAIKGPSARATPSRVAWMARDWSHGDLFIRVDALHSGAGRDPLEFPLAVVLFPGFLAHHGGLVVHAAGVVVDGRAVLLAGRSGAGKTTAARLCERAGFTILNDERVILRLEGDRVVAHGTPWHGEMDVVSAACAPLAALAFLEHGTSTRAIAQAPPATVRRLVPRCRLPYWDPEGMARVLETASAIADRVPTYALPFVPDDTLTDVIRVLSGSQ